MSNILLRFTLNDTLRHFQAEISPHTPDEPKCTMQDAVERAILNAVLSSPDMLEMMAHDIEERRIKRGHYDLHDAQHMGNIWTEILQYVLRNIEAIPESVFNLTISHRPGFYFDAIRKLCTTRCAAVHVYVQKLLDMIDVSKIDAGDWRDLIEQWYNNSPSEGAADVINLLVHRTHIDISEIYANNAIPNNKLSAPGIADLLYTYNLTNDTELLKRAYQSSSLTVIGHIIGTREMSRENVVRAVLQCEFDVIACHCVGRALLARGERAISARDCTDAHHTWLDALIDVLDEQQIEYETQTVPAAFFDSKGKQMLYAHTSVNDVPSVFVLTVDLAIVADLQFYSECPDGCCKPN